MEDLSLHILDIAENSIRAGATKIEIEINVNKQTDKLILTISDNGKGMTETEIEKAMDPFFSTKSTRRIGMGIPLLKESAVQANGNISIKSQFGKGTTINAWFQLSHIDRRPFGKVTETIITLIAGNPEINIIYKLKLDNELFMFSTEEIKKSIKEIPINSPDILNFIRNTLNEHEKFLN